MFCFGIDHTVSDTKHDTCHCPFLISQEDNLPSHQQNEGANEQLLGLDSTADNLQSPQIPQHSRQSLLATAGATPLPGQNSDTEAISSEQSLGGVLVDDTDEQECQQPRACLFLDGKPIADENQVHACL